MYKKTDRGTVVEAAPRPGIEEQGGGKRMRQGTFAHDEGDDRRSSDRER